MEYDPNRESLPGPVDPELAACLEQSIRTIWTLLPEPLQVSVVVSLIDALKVSEIAEHANREIEAALRVEGRELSAAFPVVEISRKDLLHVGLTGSQANYVTNRQMQQIAGKMATYVSKEDFWADLAAASEIVLASPGAIVE